MKIGLVGCGHMGQAMLAGWLRHGRVTGVEVIDPSYLGHNDARVRVHASAPARLDCDLVVMAVKPQVMSVACQAMASALIDRTIVMSIAAGVSVSTLQGHFGKRPLVRAMPNTPGAIGLGITGFYSEKLDTEQLDIVVFSLSALGEVVAVEREDLIDSITAVSGSGPAYIYAVTEMLAKAGQACGLDAVLATKLARQTVIGAAGLMAERPDQTPAALRQAVTSTGGTTAAALDVLMREDALGRLLGDAVKAAASRAKELAAAPK